MSNTLKKAEIIMLPTQKVHRGYRLFKVNSRLIIQNMADSGHISEFSSSFKNWEPQHLYVLSDEERLQTGKKDLGCFYMDGKGKITQKLNTDWQNKFLMEFQRKIIATTDPDLLYTKDRTPRGEFDKLSFEDGFDRCNFYPTYLSKLSMDFMNTFEKEYNKGNILKEILVEYETQYQVEHFRDGDVLWTPNPIKWIEENEHWFKKQDKERQVIKTDSNNCITIKKCKDSYTRQEVYDLLINLWATDLNKRQDIEDWIAANL